MDYYSILGVGRNASPEEIKKAYKKKVMKHHPDRGGDADQFRKISEAYETLSDPAKKSAYDNPQARFDTSHMQGNPNFEDMFSSMFQQPNMRPRRPVNDDITVVAKLDLTDVMQGKNLIISYRLSNGAPATVEVTIPPGVDDGSTIRYRELGDNRDPRFPRGDLHVRLKTIRHPNWTREGNNLRITQKVNVFDLILGTVVFIKTPDNKNVRVNIPTGTKNNTTFSIPGYGIPDLNTRKKGNVYVTIEAIVPSITDKELLEKIKDIRNEIDLQS